MSGQRPRDEQTEARLGRLIMLLLVVMALITTIVGLAREARAQPSFPPLEARVTDSARILPGDVATQLETALKALEDTTGTQLVVATVPSLQGYEIEDYGYQLGRAWGIGQKDTDNGAILLVAPNERKVRIEVGYGLEGVLTDAMTSQIIRRQIIPRFKAGDMAGGVVDGTAELIRLLQLPPEEAQAAALAAKQRQSEADEPDALAVIFWIIIIVLWIFFSVARGNRGRRRGASIIWGSGVGGGWGGGSGGGWGGGGGFGGGGFGGGGGGFGGGGSSGSW